MSVSVWLKLTWNHYTPSATAWHALKTNNQVVVQQSTLKPDIPKGVDTLDFTREQIPNEKDCWQTDKNEKRQRFLQRFDPRPSEDSEPPSLPTELLRLSYYANDRQGPDFVIKVLRKFSTKVSWWLCKMNQHKGKEKVYMQSRVAERISHRDGNPRGVGSRLRGIPFSFFSNQNSRLGQRGPHCSTAYRFVKSSVSTLLGISGLRVDVSTTTKSLVSNSFHTVAHGV